MCECVGFVLYLTTCFFVCYVWQPAFFIQHGSWELNAHMEIVLNKSSASKCWDTPKGDHPVPEPKARSSSPGRSLCPPQPSTALIPSIRPSLCYRAQHNREPPWKATGNLHYWVIWNIWKPRKINTALLWIGLITWKMNLFQTSRLMSIAI